MSAGPFDIRHYAEEALQFLDSAQHEHDFRKKHGDYGISSGWELTAEDMLKHLEKARLAVESILDLVETAEQLIGAKEEDDETD